MDLDQKILLNEMQRDVKISVVIPVYNRPDELTRALHSVLEQTFRDFEVIVVDDGSTANIQSVCQSFKDARIRFVRNEAHSNANVARNIGIRESKGEYVSMLDSDDEFLPEHLAHRLLKIKEWGCDGIFGSAYIDYGAHRVLSLSRPLRTGELMINYLLSDGFAPTPSHFYKREAALAILWDESLDRHQDFDFTLRFSKKFSFRCDIEPTVLVNWKAGEKRTIKYDSCIRFINHHKAEILPRVYNFYHRSMYSHVQRNAVIDRNVERHYAVNSYKYIYAVPFSEFVFVHKTRRIFHGFLFAKFILLHILFFIRALFTRDAFRDIVGSGRY
ncbi:MAG: glycosyltransferase family 2 protein [Anaerolineales bacterium]|jgi:glycosyltransferase involved in cell wall biosynthesis|nr:glycosyltransferase family 2 protein [Anaerolineales bacterium]